MTVGIIFGIISFLFTVFGIRVYLRVSRRAGIIDIPNERSSHDGPIPRGGGFVIVIVTLGFYWMNGAINGAQLNWGFVGGSLLIALIGFIDDIFSIPVSIRLLVQLISAVLVVYFLGSYQNIYIPGFGITMDFGVYSPFITVLFILWMINAFNFMDGIDGIAGSQGLMTGIGWAAFGLVSGESTITAIGLVIAGACGGFLVFNWQPARVFMGDVGSTFLGFTFAVFPLVFNYDTKASSSTLLFLAVIFAWLFLYDTVITRVLQIAAGKQFWKPHREHQYQKLVIAGVTHSTVAFFFGWWGLILGVIGVFAVTIGGVFEPTILLLAVCAAILLSVWTKKRIDVAG